MEAVMQPEPLTLTAPVATDFAFTPVFPAGKDFLAAVAKRLDKLHYTVLLHRPTGTWILHAAKAEDVKFVTGKLQTITRHTDVRFLDLLPLDRFHGELVGLFPLPTTAQLVPEPVGPLDEASRLWEGVLAEERAELEREHRLLQAERCEAPPAPAAHALELFGAQVGAVNALLDAEAVQTAQRPCDWNEAEKRALPAIPPTCAAFGLARPALPCDWLVLGWPVSCLNFYHKKRLSVARQLAWTLFRMQRAGLTPQKDVAHVYDFLLHFSAIAGERRGDNIWKTLKDLWQHWTGQPFPELPPAVAARIKEFRVSRDLIPCVVCNLPIKDDGRATCGPACDAYACGTHRCALTLLPQSQWKASVGETRYAQALFDNIRRLHELLDLRQQLEHYPAERNLLAAEAAEAMKRDGCCWGHPCRSHAKLRSFLNVVDEQHHLFRSSEGVRWHTVEQELARLLILLRPVQLQPTYACGRCEEERRARGRRPPAGVDLDAFMAWMAEPVPEGCTRKRPFAEFDPAAEDAARKAKWAKLSEAERALKWNPIPGSFSLVPPLLAEADSD